MEQTAKPIRENRTITVDFHDETTYFALVGTTQAFTSLSLPSCSRLASSSSIRPTAARLAV
jgi:hypothetical protein